MPVPPQNRLRIGAAAAALFFALFLLDFGANTRLWELIGDSAHVPIFAATVFGLYWLIGGGPVILLWCALAASALVLFIELVQPTFGRSASVVDMKNGFLGVAAGACAAVLWQRLGNRALVLGSVAVLGGLVVALLPAYEEWRLVQLRDARLPLLADFESPGDTAFWSAISEETPEETFFITPRNPHSGGGALKVNTVPLQYSGVEMRLESMDWRKFQSFEFSVRVDEPRELFLRVDDWEDCWSFDSRFNRTFRLTAGWNSFRVPIAEIAGGPKKRRLNISQLKRALFFFGPGQESASFVLDDLKLS